MATASRNVRKIRRVKRERSLAIRLMNQAIGQRDQARMVAYALERELLSRDKAAKEATTPTLTITKVDEAEEVSNG